MLAVRTAGINQMPEHGRIMILKHLLFNVLAGSSLLLCLSTAMAWATGVDVSSRSVRPLSSGWGWFASIGPVDGRGQVDAGLIGAGGPLPGAADAPSPAE